MDDVVSKRRIWSLIIKKSIDDLKKVSCEFFFLKTCYFFMIQNEMEKINEDNRALRLRVESMETLLR